MGKHANKIRQRMVIDLCDLASILDKNLLKTLEIAFQSFSDFKIFLGKQTPDPPSGSPNRRFCDLSVIEKYPHFAYLKSWTVWFHQ